jgi:putative phosphoesterase
VRLGVISDTHGKLRPQVFDVFAEVDHILHGGDVGPAYGNMDGFEIRQRCPQVAQLELDGFLVTVTHGDQLGFPNPQALRQAFPDAEIIVYGHTHRPLLELVDKTVTVMNPGSAGPGRSGLAPSVGIMELEPGIPPRARIVEL